MSELKRVLVVDDEIDLRELFKIQLQRKNFDVEMAENGVDAFQKLQSGHFDAVLSDIRMPNGDGMWLTEQIQTLPYKVPIVLISGYTDLDPELFIRKGAFCILSKPCPLTVVADTLKKSMIA
jgi:two-component system response regulator PilR (NtrC family)